jgi:hypothetical protein
MTKKPKNARDKTGKTLHERHTARWAALKKERASWLEQYRDISKYIMPRMERFLLSDRNKGGKRFSDIYDSTGTRALRVNSAGMMAGMTSPARPWFRLATPDPALMEDADVKLWMDKVTKLMRDVFAKSNLYRSLHSMYEELAAFGTAAMIIEPDFDNVVHCHTLTAGEYAIAADDRGYATTLYREFDLSVAQLVERFGFEACSVRVQGLFDRGDLDTWVTVLHAIAPRIQRDASKKDSKNMPFESVYLEVNGDKIRCCVRLAIRFFRRWCRVGLLLAGTCTVPAPEWRRWAIANNCSISNCARRKPSTTKPSRLCRLPHNSNLPRATCSRAGFLTSIQWGRATVFVRRLRSI